MDFAEAIEITKKFPNYNPKIFKGFDEWGVYDTETEGYVVLTEASSGHSSKQLENYVKSHKLRIGQVEGHLMICTLY